SRVLRRISQRLGLAPRAQRRATWTGQAEASMRRRADGEARFASSCDARGQLAFERSAIIRLVARSDGLVALEEPVHDLDHAGALTQHRERIEPSLDRILALDKRLELDVRRDAVALVVEHDVHAVCVE